MKKTININLGGLLFAVDEDAYAKLAGYLRALESKLGPGSETAEILADVESRLAELLKERIGEAKQVLVMNDIEEVITIMGKPEDYLSGEEQRHGAYSGDSFHTAYESDQRKLFRDTDNRVFGGVSAGLAAYFQIDRVWIRLLFIAFTFAGFGILLYLILWIVVPAARTTAEKLQMQGKSVTLSNIEAFVRAEAQAVGQKIEDFSARAKNYNYSQAGKSAESFVRRSFDFIVQLLRMIARFILKLFGLLLLFIGATVLLSLLVAVFWGTSIMGQYYDFGDSLAMMQSFVGSGGNFTVLSLGMVLLLLAPLSLLIYYALQLLLGLDDMPKPVRRGLIMGAFIGLLLCIISGVKLGLDFQRKAYFRQQTELSLPTQNLNLQLQYPQDSLTFSIAMPLLRHNDNTWYNNLDLYIEPSRSGYRYVQEVTTAWGSTPQMGRENAKALRYSIHLDEGLMRLPLYFSLAENVPYRGHQHKVYLYLNAGDTLQMGKGVDQILRSAPNQNRYRLVDMVNHTWRMEEQGLRCLDCLDLKTRKTSKADSTEF